MRAGCFDDILFRARAFDSHPLRRDRIGGCRFDGMAGSNRDFASGLSD